MFITVWLHSSAKDHPAWGKDFWNNQLCSNDRQTERQTKTRRRAMHTHNCALCWWLRAKWRKKFRSESQVYINLTCFQFFVVLIWKAQLKIEEGRRFGHLVDESVSLKQLCSLSQDRVHTLTIFSPWPFFLHGLPAWTPAHAIPCSNVALKHF